MLPRQRQDQPTRSLGEALPAECGCDFVADVSGVMLDGVGRADAEADAPDGVIDAVDPLTALRGD